MPTAAATPRALRGKVGVSPTNSRGGGKTAEIAGFVTWFSIPDRDMKLPDVKRAWIKAGLERECLPKDPRALYLFKRAVRKQQGRTKHDDGSYTEILVKDVLEASQFSIYQTSRVERDKDQRVVEYPPELRVIFNKETDEINFNRLGDTKLAQVKDMQDDIMDFYEGATKVVDGRKVRTLVRNYLKETDDESAGQHGLSGENLRGKAGGVYFVAAKYEERLAGLAECLDELYGKAGDEVYGLYFFPVANDKKTREMIREAHIANTVKEAKQAIRTVGDLLQNADRQVAIRSDVTRHWTRTLHQLKKRSAEYNDILRDEQDEVESIIRQMDKQVRKLPGA